jgi:hypothetical protein
MLTTLLAMDYRNKPVWQMKTIWLVKEAQNHQNGKDDDTFY